MEEKSAIEEKRVREFIAGHAKAFSKVKIVRVTTTQYYQIPAYEPDPDSLLKEWFSKFTPTSSHVFRDSSLLVHHFNGDAKIIDIPTSEEEIMTLPISEWAASPNGTLPV